jgi:hypothetical protein
MSHKFVLIENVSFKLNNDFQNISRDEIQNRFSSGVTYYTFNGTLDLFRQMNQIMGSTMLELINCSYDTNTVIQSAYIENDTSLHQKVIFFKRRLRVDDSYTFLEFKPELPDLYEYEDITQEDLVNMLYNKYIHNGVILYSNGDLENIEYIYNDSNDSSYGTIVYKRQNGTLHSAKYLHLINIMQNLKDETTNDNVDESTFNAKMQEKMNDLSCTHLYNQKDFGIGTFNCYYPIFGEQPNQVMSKLLNEQVYGNVIITLETRLNSDERLLNLDVLLFQAIMNTIKNPNFVPKNKHYFNIYHELL